MYTTLGMYHVHHPGYTMLATVVGDTAAAVTGRRGFTALTREVTVLNISDEPLTVAPLSSLSRFTVGQLFPPLGELLEPHVNTVGGRHVAQSAVSPLIQSLTITRRRVCPVHAPFDQECGNQAGILLGSGLPNIHPFHCPTVRNLRYSEIRNIEV